MKTEKGDEAYLANEKTDSGGILQAIKKSTFSVLYVLLKEEDGGILRFFLENVIDYLQMFEFIFNEKVKHVTLFL
jgi:hypothetical protein